eukprot:TRINITY_DN2435_c0_g1_i1.p1 TRINITY_DN2435_c0_g1~~TRINITY_DN2435_c0_g1_i1.p1  ORF type:complete len:315 (-),score=57.37 TRINITY_DN2435_c0_g1_i1:82-1026(-)
MRLTLCCQFTDEPIKFRVTTVKRLKTFESRAKQLKLLSEICEHNCKSLLKAIEFCEDHFIKSFRITSRLFPLKTHDEIGYNIEDLPSYKNIFKILNKCKLVAIEHNIRLSFHPDQFVILNSLKESVIEKSIEELEYQAEIADLIGATVLNIHGGGVYGDKDSAVERLTSTINGLSERVKSKLTLENDDRSYTPYDLLPVCHATGVPLVYDVHHHRCNSDGLSITEVTKKAMETWKSGREPMFHVSSPRDGWISKNPRPHHDYIDISDFPIEWLNIKGNVTVDVEAKAKELAVFRLREQLLDCEESSDEEEDMDI